MKSPSLLAVVLLASWGAQAASNQLPDAFDFDHDGKQDRVVWHDTGPRIQTRVEGEDAWIDAGYGLPDGIPAPRKRGEDTGLRFVDLNADGFDDLVFSDADRYAVYLWTKEVRPDLGWTRGWSQFVRAGNRTGSPGEPPSLLNQSVRIDGDDLVLTPRTGTTDEAPVLRIPARSLIAFDIPPALTPIEALGSFSLPSGFQIELVAAEPVVIDPVYFDWDASGRLWVVEMRDYPLGIANQGKPGGVIKRLEDPDQDGCYDRAIPFLEDIPFPSSLMPWRNGLLIAAAPDLFYAEDTDGDGRADKTEVLFSGFNPGNQQHRLNGFEWGLDGWIYAANGDSGGQVFSHQTGRRISISGRDIRFRPDTGELETVSAQTQFGRRRDDWGNWFGNNNPTWLWHVTLPEHYLRRNPQLAVKSVIHVLANYPESTRVYPSSPSQVRPNQPWSLNHVTSACSPTPYRDDLFGPAYENSVFISEPVHNTIHQEVLEHHEDGFTSHRAATEQDREFLASSDNWFRPVTTRTGPDGTLYIADMYRFVIEHPEWISPEMQSRLDLRSGDDKGRIYRVKPTGRIPRAIPDLSRLSPGELVHAMTSLNGWQRDTAMRLLLDKPTARPIDSLLDLLRLNHPPQVRLQALATLALLDGLDEVVLTALLRDPHPDVRCESLRQSERFTRRLPELFGQVARLAMDPNPKVRLQAAFTLGAWPPERAEPVLTQLAASLPPGDSNLKTAIMSSLQPNSLLFQQLKDNTSTRTPPQTAVQLKPSSPDRQAILESYRGLHALSPNPARGQQLFTDQCAPCHRINNIGHEVGPDLSMVRNKPIEWMLNAILDPSQAIDPRYQAWHVETTDGHEWSGLLSTETANNIVIRVQGGQDEPILRSDIAEITPSAVSLMPEGFESALDLQAMADLLGWLREQP
ncbi:MAG: PVC-type heme-binding CxxCH protein [Limisphaerales bacterium]